MYVFRFKICQSDIIDQNIIQQQNLCSKNKNNNWRQASNQNMENLQIENPASNRLQLVFAKKFDTTRGNLIKASSAFLEALDDNDEIVIQGNENDEIIIPSDKQSMKLQRMNISTTFLVVDSVGAIHQQCCNYIEMGYYIPPYNQIYTKIDKTVSKNYSQSIKSNNPPCAFISNFQINETNIKKQYKLSGEQFQKLQTSMNMIYNQETGNYIYIPNAISVNLMRKLIEKLSEHNKLLTQITYQQIGQAVPQLVGLVFQYVCKLFQIKLDQSNMYCIDTQAICHYVVLELALAKKQYTKTQFHEILDEMLTLYLPAQAKRPEFVDKIYWYFISKQQSWIYYDYMTLDADCMNRLKFLNSVKKRWNAEQLKAIFRGLPVIQRGKQIPSNEIMLKKFRKFGQQYEIRIVVPK